mgnify:CR=1 FL=1
MWFFEEQAAHNGYTAIAGVDEAGRGPLAGPVVSAAVILPSLDEAAGIDDSKKLSPARRDRLFEHIFRTATAIGVGILNAAEIDRINILQAALQSMAIAVRNLQPQPDYLLIDGNFEIPCHLPQEAIKKGDSRSASIAAASIIAKVTRDRMRRSYHRPYPQYGLVRHKGYPTKAHREAIRVHGCSPIHRKTFRGVAEHLS